MRNIKVPALALFLALALSPAIGHAADKQISVIGTVDCGQDTCSIVPPKGSSQPLLSFMVKSKTGRKILKQANLCSSGPLQMTVMIDAHENITKVLNITCAK